MKFIGELHEGEKISGIYLCKHKQGAVTKNGKPYENVILQDKTGTIDGKIWANVYTTNMIVMIDPQSGNVDGVVDCTGLLPDALRTDDTDVLNGIAYDSVSGKIYLTGKNWPRLYQVEIVEKK